MFPKYNPTDATLFIELAEQKMKDSWNQAFDSIKNIPVTIKQRENMKQIMTLDLNVLDLCTVDQLSEVEALIAKIKNQKTETAKAEYKKQFESKQLAIKHEKRRNVDDKLAALNAITNRIESQKKWIETQRELREKTHSEYIQLRNAYNAVYRIETEINNK